MDKELKDLLLKDLCARLPYGVKVLWNGDEDKQVVKLYKVMLYGKGFEDYTINGLVQPEPGYEFDFRICEEVKPYLRPMSSMTEEEKKEILNILCGDMADKFQIDKDGIIDSKSANIMTEGFYSVIFSPVNVVLYEDFLNSHYLDHRGLIPMGLALEAPKGMYKI